MKKLVESFGEMAQLSEEAENALLGIIEKKEFKKREILVDEGKKVCDQIYFVEKEVTRAFYYKDGKEITFWIAAENEFVGSFASFFSRTVSNKYVETLDLSCSAG